MEGSKKDFPLTFKKNITKNLWVAAGKNSEQRVANNK